MNANLIRAKMKEHGFTQAQVAAEIGISSNSLSRKLHGERDFRLSEVNKLCRVLFIDDP